MAPARSLLPHWLALLYGLAIAYASLEPFSPWLAPEPGTPFFLLAPLPARWPRADAVVNLVAYVPLGFFVALARDARGRARVAAALGAGALLSLALETTQMFLPSRNAATADLVANALGAAAGGALAVAFARAPRLRRAILALRTGWFLPGTVGDVGLALLAVWLAVQVNPGIPLFATTFEPDLDLALPAAGAEAPGPDLVAALVVGAASAFQLLGVGLFVALLLRQRRFVGGALLLLVGSAFVVKGAGALLLLKPAAWAHWLSPAVSNGLAAGALLLLAAVWLPRAAQVALAAIALLASLLAPLLVPEIVFARAPLAGFNWSYGQLLNFNGLTRAVLLAWPIAASALLFALAGRPDWGATRE